ncbi:MAG: hypothetical protein IGS54_18360 [Elainella sp. C42_A2020_010]|nr:hypothetical protein [Elainella sp. C42_A2020_010]
MLFFCFANMQVKAQQTAEELPPHPLTPSPLHPYTPTPLHPQVLQAITPYFQVS